MEKQGFPKNAEKKQCFFPRIENSKNGALVYTRAQFCTFQASKNMVFSESRKHENGAPVYTRAPFSCFFQEFSEKYFGYRNLSFGGMSQLKCKFGEKKGEKKTSILREKRTSKGGPKTEENSSFFSPFFEVPFCTPSGTGTPIFEGCLKRNCCFPEGPFSVFGGKWLQKGSPFGAKRRLRILKIFGSKKGSQKSPQVHLPRP